MPNLFKLNLVNAFYNFKSVDMSGISEGSKGSKGCEVGDCSDISQVFYFLLLCNFNLYFSRISLTYGF